MKFFEPKNVIMKLRFILKMKISKIREIFLDKNICAKPRI